MESRLIEAPASGETRDYKMLVGGEWVDALSGNTFESINPYTDRVWATAPEAGEEDVDRAVRAARAAFDEGPWGTMIGTERARLMRRLADLLTENAQELATVESTDNGKLLREMGGQLGALAEWYYYFAGAADKIQGETIPSDTTGKCRSERELTTAPQKSPALVSISAPVVLADQLTSRRGRLAEMLFHKSEAAGMPGRPSASMTARTMASSRILAPQAPTMSGAASTLPVDAAKTTSPSTVV